MMNRKQLQRKGWIMIVFELVGVALMVIGLKGHYFYLVGGASLLLLAYWRFTAITNQIDALDVKGNNDAEKYQIKRR